MKKLLPFLLLLAACNGSPGGPDLAAVGTSPAGPVEAPLPAEQARVRAIVDSFAAALPGAADDAVRQDLKRQLVDRLDQYYTDRGALPHRLRVDSVVTDSGSSRAYFSSGNLQYYSIEYSDASHGPARRDSVLQFFRSLKAGETVDVQILGLGSRVVLDPAKRSISLIQVKADAAPRGWKLER
ncbi:hypothetical protein [Flaviaesturariibacter terrae]